ncbi:hypothetical protein [Candidatus Nitrospira bockiana]
MVPERAAVMREVPRTIEPIFDKDVGGRDRRVDLVELPVVRDHPIAPQDALRLHTQHPLHVGPAGSGRCRSGALAGRTAKCRYRPSYG